MDDQPSDCSPSAPPPDSDTLPPEAATGPAAPDERADQIAFLGPPPTAGHVTRALTKGVCRKRSFKRQAPPPPPAPSLPSSSVVASVAALSTSSDEAMSSGTETGDGPPTPRRSKASREAMMKLQGLTYAGPPAADTRLATPVPSELSDYEYVGYYGSPELNYYPYMAFPGTSPPFSPSPLSPGYQGPIFGGDSNYPPPWGRGGGVPPGGLIHSASEGSVVPFHRRPGPLVPLPEETTAADGVLVTSHPGTTAPPVAYTRAISPTLNQATQAYLNSDRRRLDRSDSVVTVAHLCEDLYVVSPRFRVTLTNLTAMVVVAALVLPNTAALLYTFFRLVFGTLFPAYYSYKAVKTKNVKEYVKWMMYWIVFAFFTCFETITDLFMAFWFPFYYELKILLVLWLLSPATRGSSVLYRKFVHPWLTQREEEIDECIARAKQQGYSTVLQLGTKGVNYATSVIMQTAIKGGGGLVNQLKRSYSVGELAEDQMDARTGGDHNSNVKALPPGHDIGDYRHHPPTHAERGGTGISRSTSHASVSHGSRRVGSSSATRSSKTRSVDAADLYHSTHDLSLGSSADEMGGSSMISSVPSPGPSANVRRRKIQDGRSPPTPPSHEAPASQLPKGPARRRGRSETGRPRPKSMINTGEVREAYQWGSGKEHQRPRLNTHSGGRTASIAKPVSRPTKAAAATTTAIPDVASHDDAMMMDFDNTVSDVD